MKDQKEIIILIAEDDDGHADLIKEALENSGVCNNIIRFSNGEETMQFLTGKEGNGASDVKNTYLLLLDINMPKMDGIEVLKRIKPDVKLKGIPVLMLTTTDDPREIEACYKLGCNAYIVKPVEYHKFQETLERLGFFIQIIKL